MDRRRAQGLIIVGGASAVLFLGAGVAVAVVRTRRASRLTEILAQIRRTPRTKVGPKTELVAGYVDASPVDLAKQAQVDLEEYSLARMVTSEEGDSDAVYQLAVAEAIRNRARARRVTITVLLTHSSMQPDSGHYGVQSHGRLAASGSDPTQQSLAAARAALRLNTNLARGATAFDSPKIHYQGHQGSAKLKPFSEILESWTAQDKLAWVGPIDGIDPYHLALFRKSILRPDNSQLLSVVEDRRRQVAA